MPLWKNIFGTSIIGSWNWFLHCRIFCPCRKTFVILDQIISALHPISTFFLGLVNMGKHFLIILIKCEGHLFADPTCNQLWSPRGRQIDCFYPPQLARTVGHILSCPFEKIQLSDWFYDCLWQQIPQNEFYQVKKYFL